MSRPALLLVAMFASASTWAGPLPHGDPTLPTPLGRPAATTVDGEPLVAKPRWILTSTIVAGDRQVAVINGRSVAPGARIEGARVASVDANGAWIENQGRRIRLDLPPSAARGITAKTPSGR